AARPGFGSPSPLSRHKPIAHEAVKERQDHFHGGLLKSPLIFGPGRLVGPRDVALRSLRQRPLMRAERKLRWEANRFRFCPRLSETVDEPRTRSIVFSIVFPRWRPSVRSFFRLTEIEKDLLRAICEPRFSHSLARGCVKTCMSQERAALFSLLSFPDGGRQCVHSSGLRKSRRTFYARFASRGFHTAPPLKRHS